jgi:hypothetical protein
MVGCRLASQVMRRDGSTISAAAWARHAIAPKLMGLHTVASTPLLDALVDAGSSSPLVSSHAEADVSVPNSILRIFVQLHR